MPDPTATRIPTWPARTALILLLVIEAFFVVMIFGEGVAGSVPLLLNSIGLLVFCVLTWRRIPWSRWALLAFLLWRVVRLVTSMISHIGPDDHRFAGSLLMLAVYLLIGAVIASPLGRLSTPPAGDRETPSSEG